MPNVIESDEIREDVSRLTKDPTIIAMADEVGTDTEFIESGGLDSWDFMSRASDEAHRRGVDFVTIGAPARAIRQILDGRKQPEPYHDGTTPYSRYED